MILKYSRIKVKKRIKSIQEWVTFRIWLWKYSYYHYHVQAMTKEMKYEKMIEDEEKKREENET